MPGIVVGCHLLCLGSCLARGVVLQLLVQTYHRLLSAFWHFYNQCLFNSFRQVIWLECESKVSLASHIVQTYHRLLSAFWHFYNQCLFNSFRQVIWLECESKVSY